MKRRLLTMALTFVVSATTLTGTVAYGSDGPKDHPDKDDFASKKVAERLNRDAEIADRRGDSCRAQEARAQAAKAEQAAPDTARRIERDYNKGVTRDVDCEIARDSNKGETRATKEPHEPNIGRDNDK